MARCSECGTEAGYLHSLCDKCKAARGQAEAPTPPKFRENVLALGPGHRGGRPSAVPWIIGVFGIALILFIWFLSLGSTPEAKERISQRQAIKQCWKGYERKSLDPPTKRFVAATCEKMEENFRGQHGREP